MGGQSNDLSAKLKKVNLRYVSDSNSGISRKKSGSEFKYFKDGELIKANRTLNRIKGLTIPPAWRDVWISPLEEGYLQATGLDDKGRKQYIYHSDWNSLSQENKFDKMIFFGHILPKIRGKVKTDMIIKSLERSKILATVVWLLEHTFIRVGNEEYAKANRSYGLTTLHRKHVRVNGKNISFEFKGKSGVMHSVRISHPRIARILKDCFELPGYEIFQYVDDSGQRHLIDSADVNDYLQQISGEDISAKYFRTWGGTVLSAMTLKGMGPSKNPELAKNNIIAAVKTVATHLGNTPKVCRNYYIHPTVINTYSENLLIPHFNKVFKLKRKPSPLHKEEFATVTLLEKYS